MKRRYAQIGMIVETTKSEGRDWGLCEIVDFQTNGMALVQELNNKKLTRHPINMNHLKLFASNRTTPYNRNEINALKRELFYFASLGQKQTLRKFLDMEIKYEQKRYILQQEKLNANNT
jgi:hypothetical protein